MNNTDKKIGDLVRTLPDRLLTRHFTVFDMVRSPSERTADSPA
ncbi:MAG: hypothetical protein WC391_07270 [Methanoregula sp.]